MASEHPQLEVETVFDVDDEFAVPPLRGVGSVGEQRTHDVLMLEATYFDTADLALVRAGVTLRRRSGGPDEGWHLKLPVPGGRLEVHRPLEGLVPPAALLALAQFWLRGRQVAPVAHLSTQRLATDLFDGDGRPLAELADDRVQAERVGATEAQSWRELEVELADPRRAGDLAAVSEALLASGARPAAVTSKLARALGELPASNRPARAGARRLPVDLVLGYLREQVDELARTDVAVRLDQADAVHGMRVACRRLRTTLAAFGPLFTGDAVAQLRAEVRWIAGVLGEARDAEVARQHLIAEVDRHDPALMPGPIRRRIDHELGRRYSEAHAGAVRALDTQRYAQLLDALEAFLARPPLAAVARRRRGDVLVGCVARSHRRVRREVRAAAGMTGEAHDRQLHEVRKAAKRARYAAELVRPMAGKPAKRYAAAARRLQEVLGDHHDAVVLQEQLPALAERAARAGESAFGYGVLHADLGHRRGLDAAEYERAWHDLRQTAVTWPG